jgi:hypothetical protein
VIADIYRRDLAEFSSTIVHDTQSVVEKNLNEADGSLSKVVHERVNNTIKTLADTIAVAVPTTLATVVGGGASGASESSRRDSNTDSPFRRAKGRNLSLLETSERTYLKDPSGAAEAQAYAEWKATFALSEKTDEISHILAEKETVRSLHSKLVPDPVPYRDFWARYFFVAHQARLEQQRREALVQRAASASASEADLSWGDDDDDTAPVSATTPSVISDEEGAGSSGAASEVIQLRHDDSDVHIAPPSTTPPVTSVSSTATSTSATAISSSSSGSSPNGDKLPTTPATLPAEIAVSALLSPTTALYGTPNMTPTATSTHDAPVAAPAAVAKKSNDDSWADWE